MDCAIKRTVGIGLVPTVAACGLTIFAGWYAYSYWLSPVKSVYPTDDGDQYGHIDLITTERNNLNYAMAISCVDFFYGELKFDEIRSRMIQILTANPWLCSRLQTVRGRRKAVYPLKFKEDTLPLYLKRISLENLSLSKRYDDLVSMLQPHEVPLGCFCIDKDIPLFKVVLIEVVPKEKYAVLVSMCHNLGDGATFYSIFNMLNPINPAPYALDCVRVSRYESDLANHFSANVLNWLDSKLVIIGVIFTVCFKSKANIGVFRLNLPAIERTKANFKQTSTRPESFISTNDILTSWAISNCGAAFSMMAINLRSRLPVIGDKHAGNYQNVIMFRKDDCLAPTDVRQAVQTLRTKSNEAPNAKETILFDFMGITNWSTFYRQDLTFANCGHVLHLPLAAPNTLFTRGIMLLFRPKANDLGAIILDRNKSMASWMKSDGSFLLETIV